MRKVYINTDYGLDKSLRTVSTFSCNLAFDEFTNTSINGKISVPKNIINFVEDIKLLLCLFRNIEYINRLIRRTADFMIKKVYL